MKVCPVCKALSFDDADICYGCLHRFNEEKHHLSFANAQAPDLATRTLETSAQAPAGKSQAANVTVRASDPVLQAPSTVRFYDGLHGPTATRLQDVPSGEAAFSASSDQGAPGSHADKKVLRGKSLTVPNPRFISLVTSEDGARVTITVEARKR